MVGEGGKNLKYVLAYVAIFMMQLLGLKLLRSLLFPGGLFMLLTFLWGSACGYAALRLGRRYYRHKK